MNEIIAFIESLKDCTTDNMRDYHLKCKELVSNIEIYGAKKVLHSNYYSINIGNIYIMVTNNTVANRIEILINNKYVMVNNFEIIYATTNLPIDEVAYYPYDEEGEYLYINGFLFTPINADIDWLLNHKSAKSARK